MRLVVLVLAVSLAGCGVLDDEGPAPRKPLDPAVYGPAKATSVQPEAPIPTLVPPRAAIARELDGGAIGVVDPGGVVQIEPETLDTASDVTLLSLRWASWGAEGAEGSGTARISTCQPTCATGGTVDFPARITLSGVKTCDGRRYFDRGEVRLEGQDPPATYVRAPC
jgi:hypothetical protein